MPPGQWKIVGGDFIVEMLPSQGHDLALEGGYDDQAVPENGRTHGRGDGPLPQEISRRNVETENSGRLGSQGDPNPSTTHPGGAERLIGKLLSPEGTTRFVVDSAASSIETRNEERAPGQSDPLDKTSPHALPPQPLEGWDHANLIGASVPTVFHRSVNDGFSK
jgi:hypothetical protein